MNNKKGISAIVATVLIILITVAPVTIIWAAIIPMINENLQGSGDCFDATAALSVISDYSCFNAETTTGTCSVATCGTDNLQACTSKETCRAEASGVWTPTQKANVSVQIGRTNGDFELEAIDIIASFEGNSDTVRKTKTDGLPGANGEKVYPITVEKGNTAETVFDLDGVDGASVAAVVKTGNTQKTCDVSGSTVILPCA